MTTEATVPGAAPTAVPPGSTQRSDVPAAREPADPGAGGGAAVGPHGAGQPDGTSTGASHHGEPFFPLPQLTGSSWREHALTRIAELQTLTAYEVRRQQLPAHEPLVHATFGHLDDAKKAALTTRKRARAAWTGEAVERTKSNIDAAEANLLHVAPLTYLQGQLPSLVEHVRSHLGDGDARRTRLDEIARDVAGRALLEQERPVVVAAMRAASSAARREELRVRSFRNVLFFSIAVATVLALSLLVLGLRAPQLLPLCFTPGESGSVVCPVRDGSRSAAPDVHAALVPVVSRWDIPIVMLAGLFAAAIATATSLRHIQGTSTPYAVPVALALLKLPCGAITAVLGVLLMRGGFVPGLSDLDTSAQILAWAVVFGYAQQVFTRLVDGQAQTVLNSVGTPAKPSASAPVRAGSA